MVYLIFFYQGIILVSWELAKMVQNVSMVKHWVRDMMNMITNVYAPMTTQEKIVKHVSDHCKKKVC